MSWLHSIVFLLLFFFPFRICAQQQKYIFQNFTAKEGLAAKSDGLSQNDERLKTDSLKKILPSLKDTARIDYLIKLSYLYIATEQKDSAEHYGELTYQEAKLKSYIHGIAVSFSIKAHIAKHFDADFIKTEKLAKESLHWYEKTSNKAGIDTTYNYLLMYSFMAQSKFDEIIDYGERSYAVAKQNGDLTQMFSSLSWLLVVYRARGNYERSFIIAQKRIALAYQTNNKIAISTSLYRIGELYSLIEDYTDALLYFRRVLQMDDNETRARRIFTDNDYWFKMEFAEIFSHLYQFDSAWHYYNLFMPPKDKTVYFRIYWVSTGECYFLQKNYQHALQNFQLGLAEHKKLNDVNQVMRTLLDIGKTYLALNNNAEALNYGREGLNIALQIKAKQFIRDGYQILYSVYDGLHQTDSAYFYYKKYITMKDIVTSDQLRGKFVAYNYEKKIDLLNKEKQIEESKFKTETFQKKIIIAGILTLLLLSILTSRNILLKRRNEAHRSKIAENELQLQNNELQLQKLESKKKQEELQLKAMVATQEEERKRISRDLHDDVGTRLSALKLFLSSLNEKAAGTNNAEIKSLAESSEQFITEAMQDVRQLLLNLSPAVLEEFGYTTAIEGLINKINETNKINFTLVVFGMKERLQKDYELALYRITQELINNVLKHAEAKNVSLQIGQRDEKIILMIEDDGKGFDVSAHQDGYGLHNLDARTKLMRGTMTIDSQPCKGTSVLIEIPYNFHGV